MSNHYQPKKEDHFTFGLWCTGNVGRDPFGEPTREALDPLKNIAELGKRGVWGFNFHDDDLVPFGSSLAERDRIVKEAKRVMEDTNIVNSMATTNLFYHKVFKDGAFTSNDPNVRAYAIQKVMNAIDLGAELGVSVYVFWGGREGTECDAAKTPGDAIKRYRDAMNFLCGYVKEQGYNLKFALEPKPNEPRGDIFLPTVGSALAFIDTLDPAFRDMVGVNPEIQHIRMSNLNCYHEYGQALDKGKLFHADLGAQKTGRFDQDLRFGSEDIKETFFVVKLFEDNKWEGPRAFDVHPYRSESEAGIWEFVEGNMRSYLILKEKVQRFNTDSEIQGLLKEITPQDTSLDNAMRSYSSHNAEQIKTITFDPESLAKRELHYEKLDQLVFELLTGSR
jgi:xylose isomerase